ncbi:unnamed protein product [Ambrosiozyma monospora]|uniref:Unnamed protein product n=1 Tax=Ambrosiozyma monospora TaxID=43982 RepID=A0A9W6YWR6_AMBMO|nr:unnamed protein product [Ambrosiozyma monospora]
MEQLLAHNNSSLISSNFAQLRKRFKRYQKKTTFSPQVIQSAIDFYSNLYSTPYISPDDQATALNFLNNHLQEQLTANEIHDLLIPFTDEELHDAAQKLASKGPSAPDPDGWSYRTWYKSWSMSGDFLVNLANHIFHHPNAAANYHPGPRALPPKRPDDHKITLLQSTLISSFIS